MHLYEMKYQASHHVRVPDEFGCGDTNFSHVEVRIRTMGVVVPDISEEWKAEAVRYLATYGGHSRDPHFKFIGFIRTAVVTAVLRSPLTRL